MFLISTEGKSAEQMKADAAQAFQKYQQVSAQPDGNIELAPEFEASTDLD